MKEREDTILTEIQEKISLLNGAEFEDLVQAILQDAGFQDVIKRSSGFQAGFDISGKHQGIEWRFEAKEKNTALAEKDLADKFDQIEREPGHAEYYIIVTNAIISNSLRESIRHHRNKWLIDIDYWSECNTKFDKLLLSYPEAVIRFLVLSNAEADSYRSESLQYLTSHRIFLEEEIEHLLNTSNRFTLVQKVANSISEAQELKVHPNIALTKLIERTSINGELEKVCCSNEYSCLFLIGKEQMGKSSLMRLWAQSGREENIIFFFTAKSLCTEDWMKTFQYKVFEKIEMLSAGNFQSPQYLSTIFWRLQHPLRFRKAFIYIFVDAINTVPFDNVRKLFESDEFQDILKGLRFKLIFSCRESTWREWKNLLKIPERSYEYLLTELTEKELDQALMSHGIDVTNVPTWLLPKLRWPGLLRLYERMQHDKPDILKNLPEMTLAEISLYFVKDRLDDFEKLHPGGKRITKQGIEDMVNKIIDLFKEQRYETLPFTKINKIKYLNPYEFSHDSWNVLLQQGFLTKNQKGYDLGNDWGTILIGKYLIDTCKRQDIEEDQISGLLDKIFDGIAPVVEENRVKLEESERFTDILWFALHYGRLCNISESLFQMLLDRIFEGQNLSHDFLSQVSAKLFPQFAVRYLVKYSAKNNSDIYLREGLQSVPTDEVVPQVITVFPIASDKIKLQLAILLDHHKDIRYLNDIYSLLDLNLLPKDDKDKIRVKNRLHEILSEYPSECCQLIQSRFENGTLGNLDLAISILGYNGSSKHTSLLRELISKQSGLLPSSMKAMGKLRLHEAENIALKILEDKSDSELQLAAIEALGDLQSERFLEWCQMQTDLWDSDYYLPIICTLQKFKSPKAYDLIISMELQQKKWIPFIFFYTQNRLRQLNEKQFHTMVNGIVSRIHDSQDLEEIWRGLNNLSTLKLKTFMLWWQQYRSTKIPRVVADLARFCAIPERFETRNPTLNLEAIEEALELLHWIGDKDVFISLLLDLMKKDIPRLFAWTLVHYIVRYTDERYKDILIKMAEYGDSEENGEQDMYAIVRDKAITCLTYLNGDEVAEVILKYRKNRWSKDENSLTHFNNGSLIRKLVDILKSKDEKLFWSAYCFLWDFLPEEAIEPSLVWIKDPECEDWIRNYLLRLINKYDRPDYNALLINYLNDPTTTAPIIETCFYSKDPQIHEWFKKRIAEYSKSPILIFGNSCKKEHEYLIRWIYKHSYRESMPYLHRWFESDERTWVAADWLINLLYEAIIKLECREFLEPAKNKYYRWTSHWGSHVVEATMKLGSFFDLDWAWNEFLKYWENASQFQRREAIKWVQFMPSETSMEWLINIYPEIGNFFNDEKEIRLSIRKIITDFPEMIRHYGFKAVKERAVSEIVKERIHAAVCSGLFGEEIYKQFDFLSDDQCARVRDAYRYSDISEGEFL